MDTIIEGKLPESRNEVCLDEEITNKAIRSNDFKMMGLNNPRDFLSKKLVLKDMEFTISCISKSNSPSIYLDKSLFMNMLAADSEDELIIQSYNYVKDDITLKKSLYELF